MYIDPKLSSQLLGQNFKLSTHFYKNTKYMFKQTVVNMLKSTASGLPNSLSQDINRMSENIVDKIYERHFIRVHRLSIVSSFSDGFFYQGCYTLYKFTACDQLQLMIGYYGMEIGHEMYGLLMKVTAVMANAPAFKLMLVYLKVWIHFACKTENVADRRLNDSELVLLMNLNNQLDNISVKYGFSVDLALIINWVERDHVRFTRHIIHCKAIDRFDIYVAEE